MSYHDVLISKELQNKIIKKNSCEVEAEFFCDFGEINIKGDFSSISFGETIVVAFATKNVNVFKILESKKVSIIINNGVQSKYELRILSIEIEKNQKYKVKVEALR